MSDARKLSRGELSRFAPGISQHQFHSGIVRRFNSTAVGRRPISAARETPVKFAPVRV